jgi:tRNA-dihydrouridine synthase
MSQEYGVKVAVLARNAEGAPAFFWTKVTVTDEEWNNGAAYDRAKALAAAKGYAEPMLAFELNDPAAHQLRNLADFMLGGEEGRHFLDRSE